MKKLFFLAAASLMSLSILAETAKINPTWEGNYRTNNANPTGWTKVTTTEANFEVKNDARFFAVQTWTIANIDKVDSLEFMYKRVNTNNGDLSMWAFPYSSMVENTSDFSGVGMAFLNDVKAVLGVYPGNEITNAPLKVGASVDTLSAHYRIVALGATEIEALKTAGTIENNYLTVNVLLCTYRADGSYASEMNYTFPHTGSDASYCTVHYQGEIAVPAILNNNTKAEYTDLATAVEEATAGDVLTLNEDVTISGSRLTILKALTIQGATGEERIICDVAYNTLMVLANDNTADYTVTFRNLIVDGQGVERDRQLFDLNNKAKMAFDGVRVINTTYDDPFKGDVKSAGSNVILSGVNDFPAGIVLNKNKRIDHQGASHTSPIRIVLSGDYVEDYVVVLNCADASLYTAVDAADVTGWELYKSDSKNELKCRKVEKTTTAIDEQMVNGTCSNGKFIKDGQLIIRRGEKQYNALGAEL
ncbi:MAG: hypothetical protein IJS13_09900 [Paludibacteraceae bacterium]|nr:hypothetical protein [Paludibacteraceae bacterium]